jgi:hypothetical protein
MHFFTFFGSNEIGVVSSTKMALNLPSFIAIKIRYLCDVGTIIFYALNDHFEKQSAAILF